MVYQVKYFRMINSVNQSNLWDMSIKRMSLKLQDERTIRLDYSVIRYSCVRPSSVVISTISSPIDSKPSISNILSMIGQQKPLISPRRNEAIARTLFQYSFLNYEKIVIIPTFIDRGSSCACFLFFLQKLIHAKKLSFANPLVCWWTSWKRSLLLRSLIITGTFG